MKLSFFEAGILKSQKQYFRLGQNVGRPFDVPVPFYVLDHPQGRFVAIPGRLTRSSATRKNIGGAFGPLTIRL